MLDIPESALTLPRLEGAPAAAARSLATIPEPLAKSPPVLLAAAALAKSLCGEDGGLSES